MNYDYVIATFYLLGILCAILALWRSRTPQGTAAWVVGLVSMPMLTLPLFLFFGRNKFYTFSKRRRKFDAKIQEALSSIKKLSDYESQEDELTHSLNQCARTIKQPGFTANNRVELLVDGESTYAKMFETLVAAEKYILFQFYIFRSDEVGSKFKDLLITKAKAGVKIYFLYDYVGSSISSKFLSELKNAGVEVESFKSSKNSVSKFQINFRNHRKIIVVDGKVTFVGGLNIGDDYLGKYKDIGNWRDTHVLLQGPAALSAQLSFLKDWYWVREKILELPWNIPMDKINSKANALVLHTGPADDSEAALLSHLALFASAKQKLWIANPYFIPPEGLSNTLSMLALNGVDVRIIIPKNSDNKLVDWASQYYIQKLLKYGVKFYRYKEGFLHQKVVLVDDKLAAIGSTNLDSRSLFINFEIQAIVQDNELIASVDKMLQKDLNKSEKIELSNFAKQSFFKQFLIRFSNLLAPML